MNKNAVVFFVHYYVRGSGAALQPVYVHSSQHHSQNDDN